jgi:hypothetical protein
MCVTVCVELFHENYKNILCTIVKNNNELLLFCITKYVHLKTIF